MASLDAHPAPSSFATDDAAIAPDALSLQVVTPSEDAAANVEVVATRCFDRDGRELAEAGVRTSIGARTDT